MACIIMLLTNEAAGEPTEFDYRYVVRYDPSYVLPDGSYDGGILEVTSDSAKALRFPDIGAAILKYREAFGVRPDGEPNRPLTAWTVTFESVGEGGVFDDAEPGRDRPSL